MFNAQHLKQLITAAKMGRGELVGLLAPQEEADLDTAISALESLERGDSIASVWHLEDVYSLETDDNGDTIEGAVTVDEAREVLRLSESEHDASIGINWDTLQHWLDYVREHNG